MSPTHLHRTGPFTACGMFSSPFAPLIWTDHEETVTCALCLAVIAVKNAIPGTWIA